MAAIEVQDLEDGVLDDLTFASATGGGDTVVGGTSAGGWQLPVYLVYINGHGGPQTVTVAGQPAVPIAAGDTAIIRVNGGYGQASRAVTYSGVTSLTVAAFRDRQ